MRTEPNLWDYHLRCDVPQQPKYYKVALEGFIAERERPVKPNDVVKAGTEVTGLWDGNSVMVYRHPALALCLQPVIEGFPRAEIWECEGIPKLATVEGAVACQEVKLTKVMQLRLGLLNMIRFACACVSQVQSDPHFNNWMLDWWNEQTGYFTTEEIARISWRVAQKERSKASENERHKVYTPKGFTHYACHYLACACAQYKQVNHKDEEVQARIAQAVIYAIYAGEQMCRPLDTIELIEKAFIARGE